MRYLFPFAFLALFPATALASPPDLCDDVYLDAAGGPFSDAVGFKLSRFCTWTNELDVSPWADHVCCTISTGSPSTASCTTTDLAGRCVTGYKFWCDYAVLVGTSVTCQQAWHDACSQALCGQLPIGGTPLEDTEPLCCVADDECTVIDVDNFVACTAGQYVMCDSPFTNLDGSVGCADDE